MYVEFANDAYTNIFFAVSYKKMQLKQNDKKCNYEVGETVITF